jgi:DNA-binding XRE family transcriptional regulator
MSGNDFSNWLIRMGLTKTAAAPLFGVERRTIIRWSQARKVERVVALACRAIEAGLLP